MLVLHYAPIACSLVPFVALHEAGAPFEVRVVNFRRGDNLSEEYLKLNPKHRVPVLSIDGEALTENVAILQWIAEQYPERQLLPAAGPQRYRAISFLAWCASGIHPHLTPNALPQRYCDLPGSEDSVRRCAQKLLRESYQIAESQLIGRDWFFERFTLCDVYFFWCFRRGRQFGVELSAYANCLAHFERVSARASVQRVIEFEAQALAEIQRAS